MIRKPTLLTSLASFLFLSSIAVAGGLEDDFSDANHEARKAQRGDWKFENNVASCEADPELYKKYDNHGPILRWPIEMTDGTVHCEFKSAQCQRIVVTLNETGHVFRVILMDGSNPKAKSRILGWAGPSKTTKPEALVGKEVPTIADFDGKWTKFHLESKGDEATVTIGDFKATVQHPSIARKTGEFTISFASGALAVRDVKLGIAP